MATLFDPFDAQDFFLSALFAEEDNGPISDDIYAEVLQFQETIINSMIISQMTSKELSTTSSSLPSATEEQKEADESSQFFCEICADDKGINQMFKNQTCDHSFCYECITQQVSTKIQESRALVPCPGVDCKGVIEVDACRPILAKELLDKWEKALCEDLFVAAPKSYCPFKDCSAMLLVDNEGQEGIIHSECPVCHRLFCASCNVPWHPGIGCQELQKLNEDERGREDLLVRELASGNKWRRCPRCKYYVERTEGCLHITCRCQFQFCYRCGGQWTDTHHGCQTN